MATTYPFRLPDALIPRLPRPAADGLCYIDVKVGGAWDGILVVDPDGSCVGIHVRRHVEEFPLLFEAKQIEDVRRACLWNRILAQVPFDLFATSLFTVFIASPVMLGLSHLLPPLSGVASVACLLSIYFMYQVQGFLFIRPLAAMVGLAQAIVGAASFVFWAWSWLASSA